MREIRKIEVKDDSYMKYYGISLYTNLIKIRRFNNCGKLALEPKMVSRLLRDVFLEIPIFVLACQIQEFSPMILKASWDEDSTIEGRGKATLGLGRILKEIIELREFLENGGVCKIEIPTIKNCQNISDSIFITEHIINPFYKILYDIGSVKTKDREYHSSVFKDGIINTFTSCELHDNEWLNSDERASIDYGTCFELNENTNRILYENIKDGFYIDSSSVSSYCNSTSNINGMMSMDEIKKIADILA